MSHVHVCARCGVWLYVCKEVVQRDDCASWCANVAPDEFEYCEDCQADRERLEREVDEAMHAEDSEEMTDERLD